MSEGSLPPPADERQPVRDFDYTASPIMQLQMCVMRPTPEEETPRLPFMMPSIASLADVDMVQPALLATLELRQRLAPETLHPSLRLPPEHPDAPENSAPGPKEDAAPLQDLFRVPVGDVAAAASNNVAGQPAAQRAPSPAAAGPPPAVTAELPRALAEPLLDRLRSDGLLELPADAFDARVLDGDLLQSKAESDEHAAAAQRTLTERAAVQAACAHIARACNQKRERT